MLQILYSPKARQPLYNSAPFISNSFPDRCVIIFFHGICEYASRYAEFFIFLADRGFIIHALDHQCTPFLRLFESFAPL